MEIGRLKQDGPNFVGIITTMTVEVSVQLQSLEVREGHMAPSHVVLAHGLEVGLAWPDISGGQGHYKLHVDDPCFATPLRARIIPGGETGFKVIWTRAKWRM